MPKLFYTYKDIMEILNFSETKSYEIIRILNKKIEKQGFRTEKGRVLKSFFEEEYGINQKSPLIKASVDTSQIDLYK